MGALRTKLIRKGMADLLKSSGVRADLTSRMGKAESEAKGSAPRASGAYADSIHIVQDTTDRAVVRLVADVPYANIVEANTGTLARALDAAR